MRTKATILATTIIIIIVVVFFEFYVFRRSMYQATTVGIINSDPSAWVNKTVVVEGNLDGSIWMPDSPLPYYHELNSSGQTIGLTFSASLNASLNLTSFYGKTLRIYGIVRKGFQYYFNTPEWVVYYIEAEKVERV